MTPLRTTLAALIVSLVVLTALAAADVWNEAGAAIDDLAEGEAVLARSVAKVLEERLAGMRRDALLLAEMAAMGRRPSPMLLRGDAHMSLRDAAAAPVLATPETHVASIEAPESRTVDVVIPHLTVTAMLESFERPPAQLVLLQPPAEPELRTVDGRVVSMPSITVALADGAHTVQLTRDEAASLGLPRRLAVVGLATADGGELGRWGVASIASAERVRAREHRARTRLVLGVTIAGGLVAAWGALALRRQRRELELSSALTVQAVERTLEERLDRAARAATLGTLAMGIAHEISTPASVIQGRAEQLAQRAGEDERTRTAVQAIADQAMRISQVVRGFLDLARGGAAASERVDVRDLVAGATTLVEHRFLKARVRLVTDLRGDLPAARGDRRLLEHAVTNLLLNACDACTPGGRVDVTARGEGDTIVIDVLDDGVGISAVAAEKALQPFFTTKEAGKGTGLGLAITSEIVRAHRGTVQLEPRTPRGTRASIALPAERA